MKDRARETLRDDDDDEGSLIRGGEGVRPLTAHTPILSRDDPEDPKARAPTLQIPVMDSAAPRAPRQAKGAAKASPQKLGALDEGAKQVARGRGEDVESNDNDGDDDDKQTETQRVAALSRIEQAMASLSGVNANAPGPSSPSEGDGSETIVNPVVADADTVLGRSGSGSNKVPSLAGKKGAPRPRRRPQAAAANAEGPATIKVPVMTPSRLRELGEMDDADAFAAIDQTVSVPKRKLASEVAASRETLGDLPGHHSKGSDDKPSATSATSARSPAKSGSSNARPENRSASRANPDAKGEVGERKIPAAPAQTHDDESKKAAVPHSAFAQPTLMANLDDLAAGRVKATNTPQSGSATGPSGQRDKPSTSRAEKKVPAAKPTREKAPDSTRVGAAKAPPSATDMAEGPTLSGTGATGEDPDWEEPTVAEDMKAFGSKGDAASLLSAEVRPGLPRPSHRVATMAPVPALSGMGPAESDAPAPSTRGGVDVSELETSDVRPGEIASQQKRARRDPESGREASASGAAKAKVATSSPRPSSASRSRPPAGKRALDDTPPRNQVDLPPPPVGPDPRENKTNLLGTIDLDPTDDASVIEAIQREARTHQLGTPEPGESVRSQPPPAPHTYHDDDDEALAPSAADIGDPPLLEEENPSAEMRKGAAAAIAKAEAEFDADAVPAFPEKIGIYKIDGPIGEGGMAEVFRAQHPSRGQVVLKRMRPSLLVEKRYVEMFVREAKIATTLQHKNIVATLDFGAADGAHYLVMEELVGMSLRDLADRVWEAGRSLPLEVILRSCAGAARGLHHAHTSASLVHRDVSPDNVFVTGEGGTKMLDFGIAKQPDSARLTRTGEIKGKVPFMSPEHILGDPPVTGQSDVWSLAVTLYWLLCGSRPFDGTTDVMTLQSVVESSHAPISQRNAALPPAINAVVDKALQKRPADRYATAEVFADALDAAARELVPIDDDDKAWTMIEKQVTATIDEALALPLPSRPARAPFPACVSVFSPPTLDDDAARVPTEAMVAPKSNSTLWLVAGLMVGAMGAFVLAAFLVAEFVLPRFFGGGG